MGQTQILFIVLSVIIVGIAVAVGITQFGQNAVESNKNALLLDCQDIVGKAQAWYRKPAAEAGGDGAFTGITLAAIDVPANNDITQPASIGAGFEITGDGQEITIVATGREPGVTVTMVAGPSEVTSTTVTP